MTVALTEPLDRVTDATASEPMAPSHAIVTAATRVAWSAALQLRKGWKRRRGGGWVGEGGGGYVPNP